MLHSVWCRAQGYASLLHSPDISDAGVLWDFIFRSISQEIELTFGEAEKMVCRPSGAGFMQVFWTC